MFVQLKGDQMQRKKSETTPLGTGSTRQDRLVGVADDAGRDAMQYNEDWNKRTLDAGMSK